MDSKEDLDPEIAELLGIQAEEEEPPAAPAGDVVRPLPKREIIPIDLNKLFSDKDYYSTLLSESQDHGTRVHELFTNFCKAELKEEKSMYREKLIPAFWNMLVFLIDGFFEHLTAQKQALYRYGLLSTSFIDDRQKAVLLKINEKLKVQQEFYFVDEWLLMVGNGKIKQSAVDETVKSKKKTPSVIRDRLERKKGSQDAELVNLKQKIEQHLMIEKGLQSSISIILNHEQLPKYGNTIAPYSTDQKKTITQIQDILKSLLKSDKQIAASYESLSSLDAEIRSLSDSSGNPSEEVDSRTVRDEFSVTRQMIKMTVGRQGNHFPFLIKTYMPRFEKDVCSKENLERVLREIETVDPGIFMRSYKQKEHRIVPYFILVPSYGDRGICWEPFDRMNRATGRGRIAIPIFPRDLKTTVLHALGDMRWQIAKEKALHYWMEEGLTGYYYDYTQKNKLKGDLKEYFIQDYILWVTYESQGIQKLTREVRSIFWRYIPYPQSIKEDLKNRGFYYAELYKKDKNRELSRGY